MARTNNLTHFLTDVADAIRNKTGETGTINAADFDTKINAIPEGSGIEIIDGYLTYNGYPVKGVEQTDRIISDTIYRAWFVTDDLLATIVDSDVGTLKVYRLTDNGAELYWTGAAGNWEISADGACLLYLPGAGGTTLTIYDIKNKEIDTANPRTVTLTTTCKWATMGAKGTYILTQTGSGTVVYVYKKNGDTYSFFHSTTIGSPSRTLYNAHFMVGSETEACANYVTSSYRYMYSLSVGETSTSYGYGEKAEVSYRGVYLPCGVYMGQSYGNGGYAHTIPLNTSYLTYGDWTTRFCRIYNNLNGDCLNYNLDKLGYVSNAAGEKKFYFAYNDFYRPNATDNGHFDRGYDIIMSEHWVIKYRSISSATTNTLYYRRLIDTPQDSYIMGTSLDGRRGIIENTADIQNFMYTGANITLSLPDLQSGKAGANFSTDYTDYQNVCSFVNPFGSFTFKATIYFENSSTTFNGLRIRVNDQTVYSVHKGEITNSSTVNVNISSQIGDMIYFDFRGTTPAGVVSGTQLSNIQLIFTELGCPLFCIMGS